MMWGPQLLSPKHSINTEANAGVASASVAPEFELQDLSGSKVNLAQYKGKRPVLLFFGARWCPACEAVKPQVAAMRNKVKEEELEILHVYVGVRDSLETVSRYYKKNPVPFPVLFDEKGTVSSSYGVRGIPSFILVNSEGKIVYREHELPENFKTYIK
jgi:peroxiredoxin